MATTKKAAPKATGEKLKFIVSDDKNPTIVIKPGMKLQVTSVQLVTPELKASKLVAARLCGGTSTCIAVIEL